MTNILKLNRKWNNSKILLFILIMLFIFLSISLIHFKIQNKNYYSIIENQNNIVNNDFTPKTSQTPDGILNLTNHNEIDGKTYTHGVNITIKGLIYYPLPYNPLQNVNVSIVVDNVLYTRFSNKTDINGEFQIEYTINYSLNIYSNHRIEVNVTDNLDIYYYHYYMIDVNATSYFEVDQYNKNSPQLAGGYYKLLGFLRYDNSSGIKSATINYYWYNESLEQWPMNTFKTNIFDGSLKTIPLPADDNSSKRIYLNLTYSGNSPYINGTKKLISINLYRNITCVWDTVGSATEGNTIIIKGQLFARNNPNLKINNTEVELEFINGPLIGNTTTDANGNFSKTYQIPLGIAGNYNISISISNFSNVFSNTTHFISIASAPIPPITPAEDIGDDDEEIPPPFQNFFIIFIPIILGITALLGAFIIIHLRKQKEEAQIVKLPLEDRIRNLKILKDTGRLEEALSYLFQSIYIELINAKYGRTKKENETIRDFAIISVRELKLNPASIYPFIQNIEKIIYDKPFIIKEKDFYASVDLFSPIYFELTGYQFILNF